jgi:hypothetical protein
MSGTPGPEKTVSVSYSIRTYILGPDDTLYRLASAKFSRMVDDPESQRLERFAGQRVRMAEVIVEVRDRAPCAVVRLVYEMLGFDADGRLDRATFMRQNAALAELAIDRVIPRHWGKRTRPWLTPAAASSRAAGPGIRPRRWSRRFCALRSTRRRASGSSAIGLRRQG